MDWLPEAVKDHVKAGGTWTEKTDPKGVLHTTEGPSWPTYQGWTIPPHATIKPKPGIGVDVRQHVPFSSSAFALRNLSGGVQTNRDFAFQFELIGTCDEDVHIKNGYYFWPSADDAVLLDLFKKVIWPVSQAFKIPLHALTFKAYPASYGVNNGVRLSGPAWDTYTGWCGHQHVPENVHGDPGAFPWGRMLKLAQNIINPPKKDPILMFTGVYGYNALDGALAGAVAALNDSTVHFTSLLAAKDFASKGGKLILVGGPTQAQFGFTDPNGITVHDNIVVANGNSRQNSFDLAVRALTA